MFEERVEDIIRAICTLKQIISVTYNLTGPYRIPVNLILKRV